MLEIVFYGIGGQGVVTASDILAIAVGHEGKYSQAFPFFGVERRGAPVTSYCRINDKPIRLHMKVYEPSIMVVLEPNLMKNLDAFKLSGEKTLVINTHKKVKLKGVNKIFRVDATTISIKNLGRPIVNTAILGAFAKVTHIVSLESLKKAIKERFSPKIAQKNIKAAEECYNAVKS